MNALQTKANEIMAQLKKETVTMQQHAALRAKHNIAAFESDRTMFVRVAMKMARAASN